MFVSVVPWEYGYILVLVLIPREYSKLGLRALPSSPAFFHTDEHLGGGIGAEKGRETSARVGLFKKDSLGNRLD